MEHDTRFHLAIAKSAKNMVLLIVMSSISDLLRESRRRAYVVPGELEKAWQYHRDIYAAIARRDSAEARRVMAEHMGQVAGALARYKVMEQAAGEPADV